MERRQLVRLVREYVFTYSESRGFSPKTIKNKEGTFNRLLKWLGNRDLNAKAVTEYMAELAARGLKPNSRKDELRMIKAFGNWLVKNKHIDENFADNVDYPKIPRKRIKLITAETAERIIIEGTKAEGEDVPYKKARDEQRICLRFILRTGLRVSEALSLKGSDINLDEGTFEVCSKGGNWDVQPLPKDMKAELEPRLTTPRLFKTHMEALRFALRRGCKALEIKEKVTPHTLRHIFCTSLLKQGVPLQQVSRLMRHNSVAITDKTYSHYLVSDLSLAMNSKHPVIRNQLSPGERFKQLETLIRETGIDKDPNFRMIINRDSEHLSLELRRIGEGNGGT